MKKSVFSLLLILSLKTYSQQVKENDVPANIRSVGKSKLTGLPISSWVKDTKRGYYVVTVITESVFKQVEVGFDGKWQNTTEVLMPNDIPAPVMATIQKSYLNKGYEATTYAYEEDYKAGKYYTVELSSEDENLYLTIDAKGTLLKKEKK